MRILELQNEFRELVAQFRHEIEEASAMGQFDAHTVAENIMCSLFRELFEWPEIQNLNAKQINFPGIDLADDNARIAIQITGTADISKIKQTIKKFVSYNLYQHYDRLIVYVLTSKQRSYSQAVIDNVTEGKFKFSSSNDVWDYQELCQKAVDVAPQRLQSAVNYLKAYLRGVPVGLANEDIDPPLRPPESLTANLLEIYFPNNLYIAPLNIDLVDKHGSRKPGLWRSTIREFGKENKQFFPSSYVIHNKMLVTFVDLTNHNNPYHNLIEAGTAEEHHSSDFCHIDEDHERIFKSLLRFSLQQRLFQERVSWENNEKEFIFLPREDRLNQREEVWQGEKKAKRTVFVRQFNKKNPAKIQMQKHLSFSVEFLNFNDAWFMAVTPNWFFSFGADFKKSGYSHEHLSWIKRQENNQQVMNHFRFLVAWLRSIDEEDLFSEKKYKDSFISFGQSLSLDGAPSLEDQRWAALPSIFDEESEQLQRLFK